MVNSFSKRIRAISLIMTFFIVLYHLDMYFLPLKETGQASLFKIIHFGGTLANGWFFITAAFWLYRKKVDREHIPEVVKKRLRTLAVPFLFWNVLALVNKLFIGERISYKDIILGFTLSPFDQPMWFIFALIVFIPIYCFTYKRAWILVLVGIVALYSSAMGNPLLRNLGCYYMIERLTIRSQAENSDL